MRSSGILGLLAATSLVPLLSADPVVDWRGNYVNGNVALNYVGPVDGDNPGVWYHAYLDGLNLSPASNYNAPLGRSGVFEGAVVASYNTPYVEGISPSAFLRIGQNGTDDRIDAYLFAPGVAAGASLHGMVTFEKDHFLNGWDAAVVGDLQNLVLKTQGRTGSGTDLRWIVKNGASYYVSQTTLSAAATATYTLPNPASVLWASFVPAGVAINFDQGAASFGPVVFNNVTEVGFYFEQDSIGVGGANGVSVLEFTALPLPGAAAVGSLGLAALGLLRRRRMA